LQDLVHRESHDVTTNYIVAYVHIDVRLCKKNEYLDPQLIKANDPESRLR